MLNNLLLSTTYLADLAEPMLLWITVGVLAVLAVSCIICFLLERSIFAKFVKVCLLGFAVFALVLGITMLIFEIIKHYDPAYLAKNWVSKDIVPFVFVPTLVTLGLVFLTFVTLLIISKFKKEKFTLLSFILGAVCLASLIVTIVLIAIFYSKNIVGDGYYTDGYGNLNNSALYVSAFALVVVAVLLAFVVERKNKSGFDARCLTMAGICTALSFALSYVKLFEMPYGGSITLVSMLPIMLFSYVYGAKKGILIGLVYGLLQALQDPFIVHPAQFLLDYPIAFMVTGLAGILKEVSALNNLPQLKFALGAIIGGGLRYLSHVLSGVFAFGAYALDAGATSFLGYSALYNVYVLVDVALIVVIGAILFSSKGFKNELSKLSERAEAQK